MAQRGRKSAAAQEMATFAGPSIVQRPDAPYELSDEQSDVWRRVVDSMPADWFGPETWGELVNYCRHAVAIRRIAQLIERAEREEELDVKEYDDLLRMQERESRAMSSLATRLRITPQTTYSKDRSKTAKKVQGPLWEG